MGFLGFSFLRRVFRVNFFISSKAIILRAANMTICQSVFDSVVSPRYSFKNGRAANM